MTRQKLLVYSVAFLAACTPLICVPSISLACTTAVISGQVTADGRPLLWKNRDTSSTVHNEVVLLGTGKYRALAIVDAGDRKLVWMGVNAAGFCIENSLSRDLKETSPVESNQKKLGNGGLMRLALETCATVDDFRKLLMETDQTGRTTHANFGVIDAQGGAAMFETAPDHFTMFDANNPLDAPHGYIVRSNFATTAQALPANPTADQVAEIYAGERYLRACRLIDSAPQGATDDKLTLEFVLRHMARDMADDSGQAYPGTVNAPVGLLPATIPTERTISRSTTVSAAVFHGVLAGEAPELTTMWTMLGDPKFSIAVPCWVAVDAVADELTDPHGGELGEIAVTLRDWSLSPDRDGIRTRGLPGIWKDVWPVEDALVQETEQARQRWLRDGFTSSEATSLHHSAAARAMAVMERELIEAKEHALTLPTLIRVAIYDHSPDTDPARGPQNLAQFLTPEHGFECQRLRPEDVRAGQLGSFEVLVMPGGSGSKQAEMLQTSGCAAIRDFVDAGGGYVGICAGSYLASAQYSWSLNLINARVWDRAHWARGTGTVTVGLSPLGGQFFEPGEGQLAEPIAVYYGQGPLLVPGEHPELPRYEVLATYESEVATKGAPVGAMVGTHAIIRGQFGSGRVICFSPHPEAPSGPQALITRGVTWAAGK